MYKQFKFTIKGNLKAASWTSNLGVYSVLVKAGNSETAFAGGTSGSFTSQKDISHVTFCGHRAATNGGNGGGSTNGVPEYSAITLGVAIVITTIGLVYLRRN